MERSENENPEIFLEEDDLKLDDIKQEYCEDLELNDITIKNNEYLLVGAYGNGSALLKTAFYGELKSQKGAFKTKFFEKEKDKNKRKVLFAELYQIEVLSKPYLVLLTKKNLSLTNSKYMTEYLTKKDVKFNQILVFDSINSKNFISMNKEKDNVYFMKNRISKFNEGKILKYASPNKLVGVSGFILTWADFNDFDCAVLISTFSQIDIGVESVMIFKEISEKLEFLKGKLELEKLKEIGFQPNLVYNEFNANKNNYFS